MTDVRRSRVLAGGERDVPLSSPARLPDGESDQLQPFERAFREVDLRVGEPDPHGLAQLPRVGGIARDCTRLHAGN